tara:strand:- start:21 stop:248 length:228 start_codon:yes stop_codon:yes gene_type:complete
VDKQLEYRAMLVFQRVLRFYDSFLLLSALTAGMQIHGLSFPLNFSLALKSTNILSIPVKHHTQAHFYLQDSQLAR